MATPEETRDRIKEMRDRIFNDSDKNSTENKIQETAQDNDLAEKKSKVLQKNEDPSRGAVPAKPQAEPAKPQKASSSEKFQQYDDRISTLSADTKKQISEIVLEFTSKLGSLETAILEKLEQTFGESNSKINGIENLVNNSNVSSSQANESLKEELQKLNRALQLDISSVSQRLSSANQKIETELQNNIDKLSNFENSVEHRQNSMQASFYEKLQQNEDKISLSNADTHKKLSEISFNMETELKNNSDKLSNFENSVEERQSSLEDNFYEKLQQNGDRISLLSADTQRQVSEIAREFANKSSSLETEMLDKFEHISFHLKKVEEQIENQIGDLSTSVQKYVLSLTDSQEDKIAAQAKKIEKNVSSLKQEIFEYKRELKADIDKKIKESELKTNEYLSKKIYEVRDLLSGEFKSLSGELSILKGVVKEKNSELAKHMKNNVSSIKKVAEKDRKYFNSRFEKVSESIQSVEAMIVKEDDLVELFQNYTLNVNISDDVKASKS